MAKPIIVVSGKNGQLGSELQALANTLPAFEFVFTDRDELDINLSDSIAYFFNQYNPAYFINCAAYTAVDKAESEKDFAYAINAQAVGNIAAQCHAHNTVLIHISTDYVFSGTGHLPYEPDEHTDPVNHYGFTKREGELFALENNLNTIIIRTSWVYSFYGNNFVKTMLRLMKDRTDINVVADQHGSPTYAADLAQAILDIIKYTTLHPVPAGIYHYSNEGDITWHQFAKAIQEIAGLGCEVHPITTEQYPTPAKRPLYSVMDKQKTISVFDIKLKEWRSSLQQCISKLATP